MFRAGCRDHETDDRAMLVRIAQPRAPDAYRANRSTHVRVGFFCFVSDVLTPGRLPLAYLEVEPRGASLDMTLALTWRLMIVDDQRRQRICCELIRLPSGGFPSHADRTERTSWQQARPTEPSSPPFLAALDPSSTTATGHDDSSTSGREEP